MSTQLKMVARDLVQSSLGPHVFAIVMHNIFHTTVCPGDSLCLWLISYMVMTKITHSTRSTMFTDANMIIVGIGRVINTNMAELRSQICSTGVRVSDRLI